MSELTSPTSGRQIWITRGHLAALGVASLAMAVLAFFLGLRVGERRAPPAETTELTSPLPDADEDLALEQLLREVEQAHGVVSPEGQVQGADPLSFPSALTQDRAAEAPAQDDQAPVLTTVEPGEDALPSAPDVPVGGELPTGGWSVQIASYPTVEEADARIAELTQRGLPAYRVAALVDGTTWHRVRVGGYSTQKRAEHARAELSTQLGETQLLVAEAP